MNIATQIANQFRAAIAAGSCVRGSTRPLEAVLPSTQTYGRLRGLFARCEKWPFACRSRRIYPPPRPSCVFIPRRYPPSNALGRPLSQLRLCRGGEAEATTRSSHRWTKKRKFELAYADFRFTPRSGHPTVRRGCPLMPVTNSSRMPTSY
jgi:hypothetical protein